MKPEYEITDDFIGVFDNYFDPSIIKGFLKYYEELDKQGLTYTRQRQSLGEAPKHRKDDTSANTNAGIIINGGEVGCTLPNHPFIEVFFSKIYPIYSEKYSQLQDHDYHTIYDLKVQKCEVGQGYHVWHCEKSGMSSRSRVLALLFYLNDVEEGGETEFLYYSRRIKAKKNRLVLFPSAYTHTHRGNPPLSGEKYAVASWVEYGVQ